MPIHSLFSQGYCEARRIHYLLKSLGWIAYGPPLVLYIAVYPTGFGGFRLETLNEETVVAINYDPRRAVKIIKNMVYTRRTYRRVYDNTYFRYR